MNQKSDPVATCLDILSQRYPDAKYAILTGSVAEGKAHQDSDLDIIIVYDQVPFMWRESFTFSDWDVEAFCADLEGLHYCVSEMDYCTGVAAYSTMISKGRPVPEENEDFRSLKEFAAERLKYGPRPLDEVTHKAMQYKISSLCDYIQAASSREKMLAPTCALYGMLGDFYLRSKNRFTGTDKGLAKCLSETAPEFFAELNSAFEKLFKDSDFKAVLELCVKVLEPTGGLLFEGYMRTFPENWRKALPDKMKKAG